MSRPLRLDAAAARALDDRALVEASGLFDPAHYLRQEPSAAEDPLGGYLRAGGRAGLSPHPLFDALGYLRRHPDVAAAGQDPLAHYLRHGWLEGRVPHPLLDVDFYLRTHLAEAPGEPLSHYAAAGAAQGLRPHPFADAEPAEPGASAWAAMARRLAAGADWPVPPAPGFQAAAVAHVFYPDQWPELALALRNLPHPSALYVTLPPHLAAFADEVRRGFPEADVRALPNAGRDIGPFLQLLPELLDRGFDAVCKVHTKGGASYPDVWRRLMLDALLGDAERVRRIQAWFARDPDLALAGPADLYIDGPRFSGATAQRLPGLVAGLYGPGVWPPGSWGFFAGSMFWFRPSALVRLRRRELRDALAADGGDADGQLSHALERVVGMAATLQGRRIGLVDPSRRPGESVRVVPAPGEPQVEPLGDRLAARARAMEPVVPELRRARPRVWAAPPGERRVRLTLPTAAPASVMQVAEGYLRALGRSSWPYVLGGSDATAVAPVSLEWMDLGAPPPPTPLLSTGGSQLRIGLVRLGPQPLEGEALAVLHDLDEIWVASAAAAAALSAQVRRPVHLVRPLLWRGTAESLPGASGRRPIALAEPGGAEGRRLMRLAWDAYAAAFPEEGGPGLRVRLDPAAADHDLSAQELRALAAARPDVEVQAAAASDEADAALLAGASALVALQAEGDVWPLAIQARAAGLGLASMAWAGGLDLALGEAALAHRLVEAGGGGGRPGRVVARPAFDDLVARLRSTPSQLACEGAASVRDRYGPPAAEALGAALWRVWRGGGGS